MKNLWNDTDESVYVSRYSGKYHNDINTEKEILRQAYATTLLGADCALTMHGGGNTSIKVDLINKVGNYKRALYVKATGTPLNLFVPGHFVVMDLEFLEGLKSCGGIDDAVMAVEFKKRRLVETERLPSIESLMHAFIPARIVDHSHPEALLKIANRDGGAELLTECFGKELAVIPYARMGYDLAMAVSTAAGRKKGCRGVAVVHHGIVAWGDTAREVYDFTIEIVNKAEKFLASIIKKSITTGAAVSVDTLTKNYQKIEPLIRDALRFIDNRNKISLARLNFADVMELINSQEVGIVRNPPLTPDYPMSRRILPLWLDVDIGIDTDELSSQIKTAIDRHVKDYSDYLQKNGVSDQPVVDLLPKAIIHPQIGVICIGQNESSATATADYIRQAFSIRRAVFETGGVYKCLSDEYLFDMQYRGYQRS